MSTQVLDGRKTVFAGSVEMPNEAVCVHSGMYSVSDYTEKAVRQLDALSQEFGGVFKVFSKTSKKNRKIIKPILLLFQKLLTDVRAFHAIRHPAANLTIGTMMSLQETEYIAVQIMGFYHKFISLFTSFNEEIKVALQFDYVSLKDQEIVSETEKRISQIVEEFTSKLTKRFPSLA